MPELSIRAFRRIIKSQGTKRTSEDAVKSLRAEAEGYARNIAEKAIDYAERDGRITIREKDIRMAIKNTEGYYD